MDLATVDQLLTTTRSVRQRLDLSRPVAPEILQQCLAIAIQAPTGGYRMGYHFVVVTEPPKRVQIAELYRRVWYEDYVPLHNQLHNQLPQHFPATEARILASAGYLADHLHEVPTLIIPCIDWRPEAASPLGLAGQAGQWGSILPAVWSLMLALRARGVGAAWTTLHLKYEQEVATLLGIPSHVTQVALLPVAYFTGADFKAARRIPARERTYWDTWGHLQ